MKDNNDAQNAMAEKQKEQQAQSQLDALLRKTLTDEARQRLYNIKLVNNEKYSQTVQAIVMLLQQGYLKDKMDEKTLLSVLEKIGETKREINIRRK